MVARCRALPYKDHIIWGPKKALSLETVENFLYNTMVLTLAFHRLEWEVKLCSVIHENHIMIGANEPNTTIQKMPKSYFYP